MCSVHDAPPYDIEESAYGVGQDTPPSSVYQDQLGDGGATLALDRLLTWLGKGVIVFAIAYLTLHVAYAVWMNWLP